jgi:hypothetical protein
VATQGEDGITALEYKAFKSLIDADLLIRPNCNPNSGENHDCETCVFNDKPKWGDCGKLFLDYWVSDVLKQKKALLDGVEKQCRK